VIFFKLISKLPLFILYRLSDLLFLLLFYVVGYRRKVVNDNLSKCFPHWKLPQKQAIAKAFYRNLCDVIVETIKAISISEEELNRRVKFINPEVIKAHFESSNSEGAMVLASHYGNWEWLLLASKNQVGCEIDAVYKPLHNPFFDRLLLSIRSRFGIRPVPAPKLLRDMAARKNIKRTVAMVADQTPGPENTVLTNFMGLPTYFYNGSGKLAASFNMPLYFTWIERQKRGHYHIYIQELKKAPHDDFTELVVLYKRALEQLIHQRPADWLWSHKRWKYPPKGEVID
jgi:KDO2-lipid IV(A) lauroyltransferase